jgi:hypothetical protein
MRFLVQTFEECFKILLFWVCICQWTADKQDTPCPYGKLPLITWKIRMHDSPACYTDGPAAFISKLWYSHVRNKRFGATTEHFILIGFCCHGLVWMKVNFINVTLVLSNRLLYCIHKWSCSFKCNYLYIFMSSYVNKYYLYWVDTFITNGVVVIFMCLLSTHFLLIEYIGLWL